MVNRQGRPLELDLLCEKLHADFSHHIVGIGRSVHEQESNFLSKAIAAFVLTEAAGATVEQAVAASIDGGQDHGVDSVFVSTDHALWLIQSKYKENGSGEPELGEVSKFRDGVKDLLHGKWERFNHHLQNRQAEITAVLNSGVCNVKVILAYSGTAISDDRRNIFSDLERAFNNGTTPGMVQCFAYGLSTLHDLHLDGCSSEPIEAEIELRDFGVTQTPYKAVYGRLSAKTLAELWSQHKDHLVEKNLRRYKGSTAVNAGLSDTLKNEAEHFFYFNNGVTFLCDAINEQIPFDSHRLRSMFKVRGLSIINGAQTVGAIAREPAAHYDVRPAEVMVTFVCLGNTPEDFGNRVTQSRNRQNAVDLEDFAALDERQSHWRKTLEMASIEYQIKQGEEDSPASQTCFSIKEVTPMLACTITSDDWPDYLIAAKTDKKKLFAKPGLVSARDTLQEAYRELFPDSLTAKQIWRVTQVGRMVRLAIQGRARTEVDRQDVPAGTLPAKEILKQCDWLILHIIFIRLRLQYGANLNLSEDETRVLSQEIDVIATHLVEVVRVLPFNKTARSIFENRTDLRQIKQRLMATLAQQNQRGN